MKARMQFRIRHDVLQMRSTTTRDLRNFSAHPQSMAFIKNFIEQCDCDPDNVAYLINKASNTNEVWHNVYKGPEA